MGTLVMRLHAYVTSAIAMLCALAAAADAQDARVFDGAPAAKWIAPARIPGDSFTVFHARRTFVLDRAPTRFVVHVSADNRYRLYVNGVQMSSGPQRSDVTHWRYETVDLAPQLHAGRNVIAALVWNWGAARPVAQYSYRTAFLIQGDTPVEAVLVNTDSSWRVLVDSAYAPIVITSRDMGNYYAAAPGDSIDGARYPWGWESAQYNDVAWIAPAVVGDVKRHAMPPGNYGEVSGWQLEPRSIPPMEEKQQRLASVRRASGVQGEDAFLRGSGDLVVPARTTASILLDQSHTTDAYPVLGTSGGAGSTVRLTYAEALVDAKGQKGNRNDVQGRTIHGVHDVFLPDGGAHRRFTTLYWRSFRYIQLDITTRDEPLRINDFYGIFTAYPFTERGRFASGLEWLGDMWRMNWNGARIGAFETYMDTPYWEQLQYIGDTRVQGLISLYVAGDDRLVRQAIEHFDLSRIPEGLTTSRYPSSLTQIIPPFSLIYVAMVHDYFMHRDDPAFVRARLPGIRGILDWYGRHVDSTGMLGAMPYWNYVDWTPRWDRGVPPHGDSGHSSTISLLYVYALERAAELEQSLGMGGAAQDYHARAQAVRAAVRARAWDSMRGLFRDSPDTSGYSQQTNVLAILADAVPAANERAVMERVLADTTLTPASYYFSFYTLEALGKAGLGDRYIEQLAPWQTMLKLGLTSAPENPEPTRSDTHAWAAHPNYGLLATVLGVRPSSPGFRTVRIEPALGPLLRAEGRVPHPLGDIEVTLVREGERGLHADVTLPRRLTGELVWHGRRRQLHEGRQTIRFE
ncbi:MAG TPA: alpha-L-rhamnosidase C-terminal domain-containing protein [Gemmatimonadaceae bacterium]|nr:alpha-L-rhamnosidase C-terminal domain-containing protein [Gemmatimonadaceae bacterium]